MPVHITDDGCRLDYLLTGPEDAPALVLSNSLGTDRSLWDAQMDRLGATIACCDTTRADTAPRTPRPATIRSSASAATSCR